MRAFPGIDDDLFALSEVRERQEDKVVLAACACLRDSRPDWCCAYLVDDTNFGDLNRYLVAEML